LLVLRGRCCRMTGPVFNVIFYLGLACAVCSLSLILLVVYVTVRQWWQDRDAQHRIEAFLAREQRVVEFERWLNLPAAKDPRWLR
jgi:hypothetical protein